MTATAAPETHGPESPIEALDAYALCAARLYKPPSNGRYTTTITPFADATIERTDKFSWYVLFERTDTSVDADAYSGLGSKAWGRCALEGTVDDVTWLAGGYCTGPRPIDDLSDLDAIQDYVDLGNPAAPVCPTGRSGG